ncbi:Alpha/Beta hydrolase protein [Aspergillus minisclerotigenes]|uniref:Alpha/Beta hydrolase protein n=1 Tax=Aspergillus minisclerotigenes TaxID=656917 RepID=A0A5N6JMT8_9EURO|nr:Alpha/Beta hydrolase protein [Aspergillus minisclerotigenes]
MSVEEKLKAQFPDTVYTALAPPDRHPGFNYKGFHPGRVTRLPRGHVKEPGYLAFPVDVVWEEDQAIPMRDGIKLYADIFRPADESERVPAIIPWSPYGKAGTSTLNYDNMGPWRIGIPYQNLSGYETFEEAVDIYDTISWIAEQSWCNGSVVLAGNSWLAISQLNFASRFQHPNLKAIAPWEGLTNLYAHQICRGGIPKPAFGELILRGFAGVGKAENIGAMVKSRPLFDEYWKEKQINPEDIKDIPMYLTASYSTGLHCEGSFRAFELAQTSRKWLRVHSTQEWHDLYRREATDDLQRFYDYYAKGYDGSITKTIVERPEEQWPPAQQHIRRYYLDAATQSFSAVKPVDSASIAHEGHSLTASSDFTLTFDKYTELCGRPFVKLYMSSNVKDDFDVVVQIRKVSVCGELLESLNWSPMPAPGPKVPNVNVVKHLGQQGMLRASHHVSLQPRASEDDVPVYDHRSREAITPGEIVPLLIPIWPLGVVFEAGEGLMLRISGHDMSLPEAESLRLTAPVDDNEGQHTVYTGGEYESYLAIPVIKG